MAVPRHGWRRIASAPAPRAARPGRPFGRARALAALALAAGVFAAVAGPARAATYYVSAAGDDAAAGTSPQAAWRTLSHADTADLQPGDAVLLRGGDVFDQTLAPTRSGTADAPIAYGSYGGGDARLTAGVYLKSVAGLSFQDLDVTGPGSGILASAQGTGAQDISVERLTIHDVPGAGINSNQHGDSNWTITDCVVASTGDSGILMKGTDWTIRDNTIVHTGWNAAVPYPRHGVYAKGPGAVVVGNVIDDAQASGISIRYADAVVEGNRISRAERGIGYYPESTLTDQVRIVGNDVSQTTVDGILVSDAPTGSYLVSENTVAPASGLALHIGAVPAVSVVGNRIIGSFASSEAAPAAPAGPSATAASVAPKRTAVVRPKTRRQVVCRAGRPKAGRRCGSARPRARVLAEVRAGRRAPARTIRRSG